MEGSSQSLDWVIPLFIIVMFSLPSILFWLPSSQTEDEVDSQGVSSDGKQMKEACQIISLGDGSKRNGIMNNERITMLNKLVTNVTYERGKGEMLPTTDNNWRCSCEGGFLPPGMLKSLGTAEAMMRLGVGQCYHKQT
jgi:hypothetical protein